jgi:hypothetical protein
MEETTAVQRGHPRSAGGFYTLGLGVVAGGECSFKKTGKQVECGEYTIASSYRAASTFGRTIP